MSSAKNSSKIALHINVDICRGSDMFGAADATMNSGTFMEQFSSDACCGHWQNIQSISFGSFNEFL
jgi:hypothetical protein